MGIEATKDILKVQATTQKTEMADAHCHLDLMGSSAIRDSVHEGVLTIITNGVDFGSSNKALNLTDTINVFAAVGIDPEYALKAKDINDEIKWMKAMVKANRRRIVAIGEIGLDYTKAKDPRSVEKQKKVFEQMLEIAKDNDLPVSVHSRESIDDVMAVLKAKKMQKVHLHFFEGSVLVAKEAVQRGYTISIPPIESAKRKLVIKDIAIDHLMAESDAPVVGHSPAAVRKSIEMIAVIKGLTFEKTAEILTTNTKKFFGIRAKSELMRG